jgi:hypothetical protein
MLPATGTRNAAAEVPWAKQPGGKQTHGAAVRGKIIHHLAQRAQACSEPQAG